MKTENIVGALAILVSVGAVGCGAAPVTAAGGDHAMAGGGSAVAGIYAWEPPKAERQEAPSSAPEYVHRHGARMTHAVVHVARR